MSLPSSKISPRLKSLTSSSDPTRGPPLPECHRNPRISFAKFPAEYALVAREGRESSTQLEIAQSRPLPQALFSIVPLYTHISYIYIYIYIHIYTFKCIWCLCKRHSHMHMYTLSSTIHCSQTRTRIQARFGGCLRCGRRQICPAHTSSEPSSASYCKLKTGLEPLFEDRRPF